MEIATVTIEQPDPEPAAAPTQTQIVAAPAPEAAPPVALEVGQLMEQVKQLTEGMQELRYKVEEAQGTALTAIRMTEAEQQPEPEPEQLPVVEVVPVEVEAAQLEDQPAPGEKKKSLLRRILLG